MPSPEAPIQWSQHLSEKLQLFGGALSSFANARKSRKFLVLTSACTLLFTLLWGLERYREPVGRNFLPNFHGYGAFGYSTTSSSSRFAYVQYATNSEYLCNAIMNVEALHRLGTSAQKLVLYPESWNISSDPVDRDGHLLYQAQLNYSAELVPIKIQSFPNQEATWADSFTKLLVFNQTQFDRVVHVDSDGVILQTMDELFLMPPAPVAMPRAYWLDEDVLSSQIMVVEPSAFEFSRIQEVILHHGNNDFDMELVNNLYSKSCIILPHRKYDLLTGEFRKDMHASYLGSTEEIWNPDLAVGEAKYLHFSDWPFPKPWMHHSQEEIDAIQPGCHRNKKSPTDDCRDRDIWLEIYQNFTRRRQDICGHAYD